VAGAEKLKPETLKTEIRVGEKLLTRRELAAVLKVSVRTVDEMVAAKEITPLRPRGVLVRFHLPDVVRELTASAVERLQKLRGAAIAEIRIPKSEIRGQMEGGEL